MRIRSITYFLHPRWPISEMAFQKAGIFAHHARQAYISAGFPVQSVRLATPPFPDYLDRIDDSNAAAQIEILSHSEGFDYVALGPALPHLPDSYLGIPELIANSGNLFFSGHLTTPNREISLTAVKACAEVIHRIAPLEKDGFANLRFAALANVPPWAPFFPAAYHQGKTPAFALALEAADLVVTAFKGAQSLQSAREHLIKQVETHAKALQAVSQQLAEIYQIDFKGLDFTPAPFPEPDKSIGNALEQLGVSAFGRSGTLAAAAFLTDSFDRANYQRTGFNGLMLPLLEDLTLAKRAAQGFLNVSELLLFAAVCGTGLDTVPLPGETTVEQIQATLLDLAALSLRLNKPLTARLMPIPGKKAGDETSFDFEFFTNSQVLELPSEPLAGPLAARESISILNRFLSNEN